MAVLILMMIHKITALKAQKRNSQRVNVYLDGEYAFGLERIVAAWLQVGQEINDEKIELLKEDDAKEVALQRAIRFLNHRPRSEHEIRQRLARQSVSAENIDYAVDRLKRSQMIDDQQFAINWIENRSTFRPRSRRALAFELRKFGINQTIIDQSLSAVDEELLAYQAAIKKLRKYSLLDHRSFKEKIGRYLNQLGFGYEIIRTVTDRVWSEMKNDSSRAEEEVSQ